MVYFLENIRGGVWILYIYIYQLFQNPIHMIQRISMV